MLYSYSYTVSFVTQQALTGITWYQHVIPVNMVSTCDVRAIYHLSINGQFNRILTNDNTDIDH